MAGNKNPIKAEESKQSSSCSSRNLRKRKFNLNRFSSKQSSAHICEFQNCGIQLKDDKSLEWHYEGHFAQEVEKLAKIRIKRNPKDFPDRLIKTNARNAAMNRIKFRREARMSLSLNARQESLENSRVNPLRCPLCEKCINENENSQEECSDSNLLEKNEESDLKAHLESCLKNWTPDRDDQSNQDNSEDLVDVDGTDNFEEYEWAGQRRIRATSLFEGGLRGCGFLTIEKGDENEVLDIENDSEEVQFGLYQYTDRDIILPSADNAEEAQVQKKLREATLGKGVKSSHLSDIESDDESDDESIEDISKRPPKQIIEKLQRLRNELSTLKQSTICNVCIDNYKKPVVSVNCWHVLCEQCWLRSLGSKKVCPQCKIITRPQDLRKIFL